MGVWVWRGKSTTVLPLIDVLTWHQQPTVLSECCFPQSSRRDGFHCETGTDNVALWHIITLQWGLQLDSTSIPSSFVLFLHILTWIKRYIHLKKSFYPFASDNENSVLKRNVLPLRCQFNKTANLQLHQHKQMSVNKYETHVCRTASNTSLSTSLLSFWENKTWYWFFQCNDFHVCLFCSPALSANAAKQNCRVQVSLVKQ